jgi:hypothetical protein
MRGPILGLCRDVLKSAVAQVQEHAGPGSVVAGEQVEITITVQITPGRAVTLAGMGNPGRAGGVSESNLSGCERRQQAERKQSCRQRRCVDLLPPHCYFSRTRTLPPLWT